MLQYLYPGLCTPGHSAPPEHRVIKGLAIK
jgi:hypothetical protein